MYDLTGLNAGDTNYVIEDWKYLNTVYNFRNDATYTKHKGKPVVAVWGIGFNDGRAYTIAECGNLI